MKKKSDIVRELVANEEFDKALALAKTFRMWADKKDGRAVQLAHEVRVNPDFYRQIGKNVDEAYQAGIEVLKKVYGEKADA